MDAQGRWSLMSGESAFFVSTEVWAPSWSVCEREHRPPDVYLGIANQAALGETPRFNPIFMFGVASDMGEAALAQARASANSIADMMNAVLRARCVRPWGIGRSTGLYADAIQDMVFVGLFKPGTRQTATPVLSMLQGSWEAF